MGVQEESETWSSKAFRFSLDMIAEYPMLHKHARRHWQWVTLNREHAEIIGKDDYVIKMFDKHCFFGEEK